MSQRRAVPEWTNPPRGAATGLSRRLGANITRLSSLVIFATLATAAHTVAAQDRAEIDRTQIIGNRELPKVLYIVPWKKPPQGDLSGRPVKSVIDEVLAPVDRDVFRRHAQYDAQIQQQRAAANPAPTR